MFYLKFNRLTKYFLNGNFILSFNPLGNEEEYYFLTGIIARFTKK